MTDPINPPPETHKPPAAPSVVPAATPAETKLHAATKTLHTKIADVTGSSQAADAIIQAEIKKIVLAMGDHPDKAIQDSINKIGAASTSAATDAKSAHSEVKEFMISLPKNPAAPKSVAVPVTPGRPDNPF